MIFSEMTTMRKLMLLHGIVGGKAVEDYASGNPCVFTTDLAKPLRRLALTLLPKQSGTGDPSPENIRPLIPWGEVGTWHGGKNLFDKTARNADKGFIFNGYLTRDGEFSESANYYVSEFIPIVGGDYIASGVQGGGPSLCAYDKDKNFIYGKNYASINPRLFTLPEETAFVRISVRKETEDILQLEVGSTATAYEPYKTITPYPVNLRKNLTDYVADYAPTVDINNGAVKLFELTLKAGTYTFSCKQSVSVPTSTRNTLAMTIGEGGYKYENTGSNYNPSGLIHSLTFTLTEENKCGFYIWCHTPSVSATYNEWQVEQGDTASEYQPYLPPVYGCSVDLTTGEVWGTKGYALLNDPDKWIEVGGTVDFGYEQEYDRKFYPDSYTGLDCSIAKSVYEQNAVYCRWRGATAKKFGLKNGDSMANPLTLSDVKTMAEAGQIAITYDIDPVLLATLTPQQINALIGVNTVWSDADGIELTYLKKG